MKGHKKDPITGKCIKCGKDHSPTVETRKKISFTLTGKKQSEECIRKRSLANTGQKRSKETGKKIRLSRLKRKEKFGFINSPETRKKMSLLKIGKKSSKETRKKQSEAAIEKWENPILRKRRSESQKILWKDPIYKENMSKKSKERWKDTIYRKKMFKIMFSDSRKVPNGGEIRCGYVIDESTEEGDYPYNKDEVIGGKIPDFINRRGQKKLIEFNGNKWHLEWARGFKTKEEAEKDRRKCFEPLGYKVLFIWGDELKLSNRERLIKKIQEFDRS